MGLGVFSLSQRSQTFSMSDLRFTPGTPEGLDEMADAYRMSPHSLESEEIGVSSSSL